MNSVVRWAAVAAALATVVSATEYELKWDDGTVRWMIYYANQGPGVWWGNDFDTATLGTPHVRRITVAVEPTPGGWNGFRVALYAFAGTPGSIIWPASGVPAFVLPSGSERWVNVDVDWTLPAGTTSFVAAQEQYYMYPDNDSFCFDGTRDNPVHTWHKSPTQDWYLYDTQYGTAMIRVVVAAASSVAPASLGRVKAMYW